MAIKGGSNVSRIEGHPHSLSILPLHAIADIELAEPSAEPGIPWSGRSRAQCPDVGGWPGSERPVLMRASGPRGVIEPGVAAFFESYRLAFERMDAPAIADHFA